MSGQVLEDRIFWFRYQPGRGTAVTPRPRFRVQDLLPDKNNSPHVPLLTGSRLEGYPKFGFLGVMGGRSSVTGVAFLGKYHSVFVGQGYLTDSSAGLGFTAVRLKGSNSVSFLLDFTVPGPRWPPDFATPVAFN